MRLTKRIFLYTAIAAILLFLSYTPHSYVLEAAVSKLPFDLIKVYTFQAAASLLLIISFDLIATLSKSYKDQLSFLYLGGMALKIAAFCIVFRDLLFSSVSLTKMDSVSLLIPIFIFLFFEVVIIVKILNRST